MSADPRAEPRFAERVAYVVVYGEPGARLVDLVVDPHVLVESKGRLRLHGVYYITRQVQCVYLFVQSARLCIAVRGV